MTNLRGLVSFVGSVAWLLCVAGCGSNSSSNVATCTQVFTACGGDPTGVWTVAGMCTEQNMADSMNQSIKSKVGSCSDVVKSVGFAVSGKVTYTAGTVTYQMHLDANFDINYSDSCFSAMGHSSSDCNDQYYSALSASSYQGTCSPSGTSCSCQVTETKGETDSHPYTISGSTISESGGDTYDFCVKGNTLTLSQSDTDFGRMTLTLTKG